MAIKDTLKGVLTNVKARTLVIFLAVIVIIGIVIVVFSGNKEQIINSGGQKAVSSVEKINPNIRYVPGGTAPPEYYETQYQDNQQRANVASGKGTSSLPTIVADQLVPNANIPSLEKQPEPAIDYEELNRQQLLAQQEAERQRQLALLQQQNSTDLAQRQSAYETLMASQAKALFTAWTPPQQAYVASNVPETPAGGAGAGAGAQVAPALYKAGDILYAVLETSVNTDEPGPILAKIVSGPLKDARIIGNLTIAGEYAEKVMLQFSVINVPDMPASLPFSGVAIDPDTARTAVASDVDNHYFLRYGTLFAASFMEGMSEAILSSISNPGFEVDGNGVIVGSSVQPTTRDQLIAGFGQVGAELSDQVDYFDRPATITVDSGTSMGILMLQDFSLASTGKPLGMAGVQPASNAAHPNPFAPAQPARQTHNAVPNTMTPAGPMQNPMQQGSAANLGQAFNQVQTQTIQ